MQAYFVFLGRWLQPLVSEQISRAWAYARARRVRVLHADPVIVRPRRARCVACSRTQVLLPAASGQAVLVDGTWRVSKSTFCTLVTLGNNNEPVEGC